MSRKLLPKGRKFRRLRKVVNECEVHEIPSDDKEIFKWYLGKFLRADSAREYKIAWRKLKRAVMGILQLKAETQEYVDLGMI